MTETETDAPPPTPHIQRVTGEELDRIAGGPDINVLVWFTTPWCGPCRQLAAHLDKFAAEHPDRVRVVSVDADDHPEPAYRYQVLGFPTLVLLHRGNRVWQRPGARDADSAQLARLLLSLLDAVDELDPLDDTSPAPAPHRPRRTVRVPGVLGATATVQLRDPVHRASDRLTLEPGATAEVPEGHIVEVQLRADYRQDPPLDMRVLREFEPDSIDYLLVTHRDVRGTDLMEIPALNQLTYLFLNSKGEDVATDTLEAIRLLPRLQQIVLPGTPAHAVPHAVVTGEWSLPELRGAAPTAAVARLDAGADTTLVLGSARTITDENFDRDPATSTGITLLDFTASWCPPCKVIKPLLGNLADERPDIAVLAVDADTETPLMQRFSINYMPTLVILRDGHPVWRSTGVQDAETFAELLLPALAVAEALPGPPTTAHPVLKPHPARTLDLPEGPLPFDLELTPPGRSGLDATRITTGGAVEVPAGWSVGVSVREVAEGGGTLGAEAFVALRPGDVDSLLLTGPVAVTERTVAELSRLDGLQNLSFACDSVTAEAVKALTDFTWLRILEIKGRGDGEVSDEQLAGLRTALGGTVVNERWSAL
ncbi:thioredoxin family protein [Streptomyces sp. NPDC057137]|uniref:thioredoxin family protein n=1 Tax=Streptomyces sp. NPDC057137 TaxID=3346030 RepID=UPI0036297653